MSHERPIQAVTVTLNPAIDQTVTISNFRPGAVNRVEQTRSWPGGKGVNVAVSLADYDVPVAVTGFLGRENSAMFETLFGQKRIQDGFIRIAGQTRTGIKIADPVQQVTTDINFAGLTPECGDLDRLLSYLDSLAGQARWFVLSGSVPPGIKRSIYAEIIERLRNRGASICLDASGEPLRLGASARPNILKPNIHELEELVGQPLERKTQVREAAAKLVKDGIGWVVVSMGAKGALFVTESESYMACPPAVTVKSTVGAGDAMVAGIIAAQLRGESLERCARLATAFSLEVLTRGRSGISSSAAVAQWMERVVVEKC